MTATDETTPGTEIVLKPFDELARYQLSEELLAFDVLNPEVQAEMYAELEEDGIRLNLSHLTRVKVPSGGITQFQIEDEDGIEQAVRELKGIVLGTQDRRSYWVHKLGEGDGEEGPPDCSSRDAKIGEGMYGVGSEKNPSGECAVCPMNARGSAGTGTQAAACKQQKLLFLGTEMESVPMIVTIPPTGLKPYEQFSVGSAIRRRRSGGPRPVKELSITLQKKKNPKGIEYAEMVFKATGRTFTGDDVAVVNEFRRRMALMLKENQEALDRMANAAAADATAVDNGEDIYDEVPDDALPQDEVFAGGKSTKR